MQVLHGLLDFAADELRCVDGSFFDRGVNGVAIQRRGCAQYVIRHVTTRARSADADAQAHKFIAAQLINDVTQAIVSGVSAALFYFQCTGRDIQLIVCNQNVGDLDLVEVRDRMHGLTAAIHEGVRFE